MFDFFVCEWFYYCNYTIFSRKVSLKWKKIHFNFHETLFLENCIFGKVVVG